MTEISDGFHAKDGWYFRRENDGSVHIKAPDSMGPGASQVVTLDADTWASVAASVSERGETADTFAKARNFHAGLDYVLEGIVSEPNEPGAEVPWPNTQPVPDGVVEVSQDPDLFADDSDEQEEE